MQECEITVRAYRDEDVPAMAEVWNEVVEAGEAFPQENTLNEEEARRFFAGQTHCGVAVLRRAEKTAAAAKALLAGVSERLAAEPTVTDAGPRAAAEPAAAETDERPAEQIVGLYILHPNNVGRCGHICNASYAVRGALRGRRIGERLVLDCLEQARAHGFGILQFNAVVAENIHARHLYERLGFTQLGTIHGGFRRKDGSYADICPYYRAV